MSATPCPDCDAPLSANGSFCKECGYDRDLLEAMEADAVLPDEVQPSIAHDTFDYDAFLKHEGLTRTSTARRFVWYAAIAIVVLAGIVALVR